jgi:hypothetical protein
MMFWLLGVVALAGLGAVWWGIRRKSVDRWLVSYLADVPRRKTPSPEEDIHVLLCIVDHFEPKWGDSDLAAAASRVERCVRDYPKVLGAFRDSDGRPPRHTFFYPQEEYEPAFLDALAQLCQAGYAEVEVHLHHDQDTEPALREKLLTFKEQLAQNHGLLGRDKTTRQIAYGFIHGNWALNNSRPDRRWCGVNDEIRVLVSTGCYADFTLPSAPSATQTPTINRIYYATSNPAKPRGHDRGWEIGAGPAPTDALMLIQGPLLFDWTRRKWGLLPRIENACLQATQPPTLSRLDTWLKARIQVPGRPDWFFVKLHTHGAQEANQRMLFAEPMVRFHEALAHRAAANKRFRYHYVSAREMFNLARAAEDGWKQSVDSARDYQIVRV